MPHYQVFKANVSPAQEAARAKEQEKALAKMAKERARIEAAAAAQIAADNKAHHKRRSSEVGSGAASAGSASGVGGGAGGGDKPAWWRRSSTASSSCFAAAADSPNAAGSPQPFSPPQHSPADAPLLEEMRRAWVSAHKVVFKDLPRLAKRTSVQTDAGTMVEGGRVVRLKRPQPAAAAAQEDANGAASSSPPAGAGAGAVAAPAAAAASGSVTRAPSASVASPVSVRVSGVRRSTTAMGSFPKNGGGDSNIGWMGTIDMRKHNKALWQAQWEQRGGVGAAPSPSSAATGRGSFAAGAGAPSPSSRSSVAAPSPMSRASVIAKAEQADQRQEASKAEAAPPAAAAAPAAASASASASSSPSSPVAPDDRAQPSTSPAPSISSPDLYDPEFLDSVLINAGGGGGADGSSVGGEVDTWQAVCNVVLTCIRLLEPAETLVKARSAFAAAAPSVHAGSDHQSLLEDLFSAHIGLSSRTFKVFQAIHQSILFPAISYLHENLYSHPKIGNMKDVRRADGWTVLIYITHHGAIYVTHQRWEQSLHPESDPRHFEVRWEMRLSFDRDMQALRAVILRIQELRFSEDATPAYRQQIIDVLAGSGYIV